VVVAHSQGGYFAWRAAQEWPAKVRALVLLEPAALVQGWLAGRGLGG
jgi:pimeloyl-ACP methyl ester carboxylesterase